jgi:hypothetical protein
MRSKVLVPFLVPGVFRNEVEVFSADDECAVHLGRNNCASQNTATNGNKTGKWTLLVYLE